METEKFWEKEWEKAEKKLAKLNFVQGWLAACLKDYVSDKEVGQIVAKAHFEADRIYDK